VLPAAALFHLLCYWKCLDDADFFSVWWVSFAQTCKGANRGRSGGSSYDPD
jgi:type IV secretory pathway VirB3-like protein